MTRRLQALRIPPHALLCLALVFATCSCGTLSYNRAWSRFEAAEDGIGMVGRWKGEWESEWNGHSGGLRCMLTPEGENAYLARFHSTYGWLLFFRHETVFHVVAEEEGLLRFEGAEDLGALIGGVYQYRGTVEGDAFEANYEAENGDHGSFRMQRVKPEEER